MKAMHFYLLSLVFFSISSVYSQQIGDAKNRQRIEKQKEYSQTILAFLEDSLKIEWHIPFGWTKELLSEGFDKNNNALLPGYRIVSPQRDVVVVYDFSYQGTDFPKNLDQLNIWKIKKIDTLSERLDILYPADYTLMNFGADYAGQFPQKTDKEDKDFNTEKYSEREVVWFFKAESAWMIYQYYFYVPGVDIDKYIKETAGMMRFKN